MMTNLPLDEYPLLSESAHQTRRPTANQEFRQGLNIILADLEASLTAKSSDRTR
jgi:hypothetical protein